MLSPTGMLLLWTAASCEHRLRFSTLMSSVHTGAQAGDGLPPMVSLNVAQRALQQSGWRLAPAAVQDMLPVLSARHVFTTLLNMLTTLHDCFATEPHSWGRRAASCPHAFLCR